MPRIKSELAFAGKDFRANPQNINRKGRPKKPVLSLKIDGYKLAEINDTIQAICSMDMEMLETIKDNPQSTILERTIASALSKGIDKGNLESIETLLNRVYGKPKEKVDITTNGENLNKPEYTINIIKTNHDGDKDNTGIPRPIGE